jgi:hypothetical protein
MKSRQLLSFLVLLYTHHCAISQPISDSEAVQSYTTSPAARDKLYNGPLYGGYDHHPQGHPFFISDTLLTGSISYGGIFFPDVQLSYDLAKDVVIMKNAQKDINFELLPEKLQYFTVLQHRFLYLTSDSTAIDLPATGFYEELFYGKAIALARHEKVIQYIGRAEENLSHYRQYDFYYLQMNGRYYPIHSERNMLDAFGPNKTLIRDFVKKSRLSFRKDPATALARTAEYYSKSDK